MSSSDAGTVEVPDDRQEAEVNDDLALNMWSTPDGLVCMIEDPVENCSRHVDHDALIDVEEKR